MPFILFSCVVDTTQSTILSSQIISRTMSPYPATRRNGTCTGSLWKSHSRASINNAAKSPKKESSDTTEEAASVLDGILAEANERQRAHEFCVLVGNTLWSYSDIWAYSKGDSPTVSSNDFHNTL